VKSSASLRGFVPVAWSLVLSLAGCRTQPASKNLPLVAEPVRDASVDHVDAAPGSAVSPASTIVTGAHVSNKTVTWTLDAAPAAGPSKPLPMGSVIVVASMSPDPASDASEVTVFEWDVAADKPLRAVTLPRSPGEIARAVRVVRTAARVYVAVETEIPSRAVRLYALRHDLSLIATTAMGEGEGVSLEASERYVALSKVHGYPETRLTVTLLDPVGLTEIAHRELGGLVVDPAMKTDHLELGPDRLFVVGTPLVPGGPRRNAETGALAEAVTAFALDLPSLEVRGSYESTRSGQLPVSLVGDPRSGSVHMVTDELVELDRTATAVRKRDVPPTAIPAFSTRGELFDGGDDDARSDLFPTDGGALEQSPRCASLWSGPTRLLACALGREGLRIVRVGKDWPRRRPTAR